MYPNDWKYLDTYIVTVKLTDALNYTKSTFKLTVTNSAPYFESSKLKN